MAPLGWRVVRHGVYAMPFFVNPMTATKTGCDAVDIDLLKFMIPHAYRLTASAMRPSVEIRHAWYTEHKSPLGSCPDFMILDALAPKRTSGKSEEPSKSIDEYDIPTSLPSELLSRVKSFEDLCAKEW
jgi:CRISPR/Cas system type I-B associated protein Csh2 (Cas7 group RAMP superfamily)